MVKIITIIIPSYNVEKFLNQTLSSFINESILEDIEVLIVDDGSKDNTAKIGMEYQDKYPETFRVIRKENGGHGSTINKGIELANGKYFKVVDGDDWVDTQEFSKLVATLKTSDSDFVVTNYCAVDDNTKEETRVSFDAFEHGKEYKFVEICDQIQIPMHSLTIKTEILQKNNIRLDEHCFYVDVEYSLYPVVHVDTVLFLNYCVYMYRVAQATQSVSMKGFRNHIQNHIDVILHLIDFLNNYENNHGDPKKIAYITLRIVQMISSQCNIFSSYSPSDKQAKEKFMQFEEQLKKKNEHIYKRTNVGRVKLLRKTNFHGYFLIVLVYNLFHKIIK